MKQRKTCWCEYKGPAAFKLHQLLFCLVASWRHTVGQSRPITCWGNICILRWAYDLFDLCLWTEQSFFLNLYLRIVTHLTMFSVVFTVRKPEQWEEVLTQPCVSAQHRVGGRPQDHGSPGKHQREHSAPCWVCLYATIDETLFLNNKFQGR